MSTDVGFRLVRRLLTITPALENSLCKNNSKYFSTRRTSLYGIWHQNNVLPPHQRMSVNDVKTTRRRW